MNEQIRIPKVLLIDETGKNLGIRDTREALMLARSKGLDLIEVAPYARPPVCRIMDYGRFKYEQQRREKEARKHQKALKEIRLTPEMSEHDMAYRLKTAEEFLSEGHRVRVFMNVWGRWQAHPEITTGKLNEFAKRLEHLAVVEVPLTTQGRTMSLVLARKKESGKASAPAKKEGADRQDRRESTSAPSPLEEKPTQ
ncbi:MAG: translation initiation factor IF-3 [Armatimonadetes bacterium]|nr:translation initiation factor IF-3 [Armatimonadota bacterium]MDW8122629.1 translation initiation factor IF-3 [Armatimonadota bacterium]